MKILVTGGAGAIGYHLCNLLCCLDDTFVYIADNFCRSIKDSLFDELLEKENVSFFNIDLRDSKQLESLPSDVDYIFHLAAMNGTSNFYDIPFDCLTNCTLPTINLFDYYKNSKTIKRFVYAGSSEAYASTVSKFKWEVPTGENVPLCIDDPLNVRWSYGASKLHGEITCAAAGKQFGIPYTIIRYHNVFGPRSGYKHVIPDFIERAKHGIYELYGAKDTRSFLYVKDAVNMTLLASKSQNLVNQIVNIGSTEEIKIEELAKKIMRLMNLDGDIICHDSPKGSVSRRAPDLSKFYSSVDYKQQFSLDEGLKLTIDYYLKSEPNKL